MNPRHVISFWLSLIILKTLPNEIKQLYRKYEKNKLILTTLIAHRYIYINIYSHIEKLGNGEWEFLGKIFKYLLIRQKD